VWQNPCLIYWFLVLQIAKFCRKISDNCLKEIWFIQLTNGFSLPRNYSTYVRSMEKSLLSLSSIKYHFYFHLSFIRCFLLGQFYFFSIFITFNKTGFAANSERLMKHMSSARITSNHLTSTKWQFHQRFSRAFFVQKCFFLVTFWQQKALLYKNACKKYWWNWLQGPGADTINISGPLV